MNYLFKSVDKRNGQLLVDTHGAEDGYIFAAVAQATSKRLKLRIIKNNDIMTYDLKNNGQFEIFSLQCGNGTYQIILYENVYSSKYASIGSIHLNVKLRNKNSCFLVPNQYVNYNELPELVQITKWLCGNKLKSENLKIIKRYIKNNFQYDYEKAKNIKKGMLPDIKRALLKKQGICFDLASLAVAMFRIAGIPAKLVIGYADGQYHAWVEVLDNNKFVIYDPTQDIYNLNNRKQYIPERYY